MRKPFYTYDTKYEIVREFNVDFLNDKAQVKTKLVRKYYITLYSHTAPSASARLTQVGLQFA